MKKTLPYLLFTGIALVMMGPILIQKGLFIDGLYYATISHNLANGIGNFWSPCFTATIYPEFYEHPPLVFGIQSIFFRLLGHAYWVEKLYAVFIIILSLILIHKLWQEIFHDKEKLVKYSYFPMLLWLFNEVVFRQFPNNLLECTQGIFIMLSVLFLFKGLRSVTYVKYIYIGLSGFVLVFSFLSKGFTGLYPFAAILFYSFTIKKINLRHLIIFHLVMLAGFSLYFLLLLFKEEAWHNLTVYLNSQVVAALKGERVENIRSSRFFIIRRLLETSILPMAVVLITGAIAYFRHNERNFFQYKNKIYFFLVLGLSGVLPMMISEKQGSYYLLTTIPFFAIALALIMLQSRRVFDGLLNSKVTGVIVILVFVVGIYLAGTKFNEPSRRNKVVLNDLEVLESYLTPNTIIGCKTKEPALVLYAYLMRDYFISADYKAPEEHELIIAEKDIKMDTSLYKPIAISATTRFMLYEKEAD